MPPLLEAKGLTKRYGSTVALDSVNFQVNEGVTGLLGPNGAGKSTAIKLFLGLIAPTGGSAEVLGSTTYGNPDGRTQLGYMPEHECLPSSVTASEFLMYMAQVSGIPPSQARTRAADILRHVGLDEERYRSIGEYSTGMKQRVKLAQAIVHDPVLVFLDEPTAGLDPDGRQEMLSLVERTAKTFGISVVLSTHLMGDVERTADSIIVLESGAVAGAARWPSSRRRLRRSTWRWRTAGTSSPPRWPPAACKPRIGATSSSFRAPARTTTTTCGTLPWTPAPG